MPGTATSLRQPAIPIDTAAASRATPPRLELLRGFALRVDGHAIWLPLHVQRMLAFLALQKPPLHRAYVSGRLWPALSQEHAFACLRTTLWRTSRLPARLVEATNSHLAIATGIAVDTQELERCAEAILMKARPATSVDVSYLVHTGELLPDWYEDWVFPEREQMRELRMLALEAVAEELLGTHCFAEATLAAMSAVRADPLRESAARLVIRCHLATGNQADALRQFDSFRARLARDLGLEPSRHMLELIRGVSAP